MLLLSHTFYKKEKKKDVITSHTLTFEENNYYRTF